MSSAGISRTGQGTKRAEAFCIAYVSQRSNKDGWLGYPLTTSFQKWSTAVCKIQANEERHLQQMRATLINTIPRSWNTVFVSASKLVTCHWFKRKKKGGKSWYFSFLLLVEDGFILNFARNSSYVVCKALPSEKQQNVSLCKHHLRNELTFQSTAFCVPFWKKPVHSTQHQNPLDKADGGLHAGIWFYYFQPCLSKKTLFVFKYLHVLEPQE